MPIFMYQFDQNIKSSLQIQIQKMSYQNENFGMMDEGYFVPRTEILAWLNNLLNLNLTKIEQLGSGAVYCQVVDVIHPGKVAISKLNWKAKNDYEFINNLKVLQGAFDKIGIKRHVEVEKLAKAKYQDNLQFIQWLKRYYDLNCGQRGNNYKPEQRRGNVVIDFSFAEKNVVPKTYNGSGAVVKSQAFQKKKAPTKVEEAPPRKTATVTSTRPTIKKQQKTLSSGTNTSLQAKVQKQSIDISAIQNEYEEKISSMEGDLQRLKRQMGDESERSKQSALRIDMIREILRTEDEAEMKVTLIQELLKEQ